MHTTPTLTQLGRRIDDLVARRSGRRVIVGIVGAPGSGKSTLAEALVDTLLDRTSSWSGGWSPDRPPAAGGPRRWIGSPVAHVPMDGFHLADVELGRLGRADRKGAPDTFDAGGYAALLERLRTATETVWAPSFDREIEQPIAGSIPVVGDARVIVTEGNYLLLDQPAWRRARQSLDEVWFCDLDNDTRRQRLIARHVRFGKTPTDALAWANGPDERNAELIDATRPAADLLVREGADLVATDSAPPS